MSTTESNALPPAKSAPSRTIAKLLVLLILIGGTTYSNSFMNVFVLDDFFWISNNDKIQDLGAYLEMMNSRPVIGLTLYLNYRLHGFSVFGYHLVNVAIHLLAALALFGVVRQSLLLPRWNGQFRESAPFLAFAVALLWMVHPLQTQAVTYVIQRGECMMGLFFLLTMYTVIRGSQAQQGWRWYLLSLGCFFVGANCKEVMVTFLPVMLVYDRMFLASFREIVRKRWWYYLAIAAYWAYRLSGAFTAITAESADGSAGFGLQQLKPQTYMMTQPGIILHYIRLVFVPYPQSFLYRGWPWVSEFADCWPAGLALAILAALTAWLMLRRHWIGFLGAWFFGILSITSIVPLIDPGFEHRMYLPVAAFSAFVVIGTWCLLSRWSNRRLAIFVAFLLLFVVSATLAVLTMRRNEDYRSRSALWESVCALFPTDGEALTNAAGGLVDEGRYDEAKLYYEKALKATPNLFLAEFGYGNLLCRLDMPRDGVTHLLRSRALVQGNPAFVAWEALANFELGKNYWMLGDRKSAEACLRTASKLAPDKADTHGALACVLFEQDRRDQARQQFTEALRIDPRFARAAAKKAEQLLQRTSTPSDWVGKVALFEALQAAQATEFKDSALVGVLAEAYAANRRYAEAIQVTQDALRTMDAKVEADRRAQFQRALLQYQERLKGGAKKSNNKN